MTTEEDFHNHLDANPDDHHARMVFADFLQEQNDPRAAGYRALGKLRRMPIQLIGHSYPGQFAYHNGEGTTTLPNGSHGVPHAQHSLPQDWINLTGNGEGKYKRYWGTWGIGGGMDYAHSRRAAEDDAALAFAKLPPERQQELLADPVQMKRRVKYARKRRLLNSKG